MRPLVVLLVVALLGLARGVVTRRHQHVQSQATMSTSSSSTSQRSSEQTSPAIRKYMDRVNKMFDDFLPDERQLFDKDDRVLIIGAGPSGVHMGMGLTRSNHTNVTIFEKSHRVGGKSYTIMMKDGKPCDMHAEDGTVDDSCIPYDMGTCFGHNGYKYRLYHLFERYGLRKPYSRSGRGMFSFKPLWLNGEIKNAPDQCLDASQYILGMQGKLMHDAGVPMSNISVGVMTAAIQAGLKKYVDIHRQYMHPEGGYLMPRRSPTQEQLADLSLSYEEFLKKHELGAIIPSLSFAYSAQGYGYMNEIPAYYGLMWITPELVHGILMDNLHRESKVVTDAMTKKMRQALKAMPDRIAKLLGWIGSGLQMGFEADPELHGLVAIPDGWETLWRRMVAQEKMNVEYGIDIKKIDRQLDDPDAPIKVTYTQDGGSEITEEYDFIIWTPNPTNYFSNNGHEHNHVFEQRTEDELRVLGTMSTYQLSTTLYSSPPVPEYSDEEHNIALVAWPERTEAEEFRNRWYCDRRDERFYGKSDHERLNFDKQYRVGYQFANSLDEGIDIDVLPWQITKPPEAYYEAQDLLLADIEEAGVDGDVRLVKDAVDSSKRGPERGEAPQRDAQFLWPYFPHWGPEHIKAGHPWSLEHMQGQNKMLYSGSFATFESVLNVVDKNCDLLSRFVGYDCQETKVPIHLLPQSSAKSHALRLAKKEIDDTFAVFGKIQMMMKYILNPPGSPQEVQQQQLQHVDQLKEDLKQIKQDQLTTAQLAQMQQQKQKAAAAIVWLNRYLDDLEQIGFDFSGGATTEGDSGLDNVGF